MPTGYIPAKKKPVTNRKLNRKGKDHKVMTAILNKAAINALTKKTFDGENRSAMLKMANNNVPEIKPNCTAEVSKAVVVLSKLYTSARSGITALPANQSEVQRNWASIIIVLIFFNRMSVSAKYCYGFPAVYGIIIKILRKMSLRAISGSSLCYCHGYVIPVCGHKLPLELLTGSAFMNSFI